jgi:hypothetical protein
MKECSKLDRKKEIIKEKKEKTYKTQRKGMDKIEICK